MTAEKMEKIFFIYYKFVIILYRCNIYIYIYICIYNYNDFKINVYMCTKGTVLLKNLKI